MPKKFLHDAVAGHTDDLYGFRCEGTTVSTATFHCGFDHQVATSPFTEAESFVVPQVKVSYCILRQISLYTEAVPGYRSAALGRGPPAQVLPS